MISVMVIARATNKLETIALLRPSELKPPNILKIIGIIKMDKMIVRIKVLCASFVLV